MRVRARTVVSFLLSSLLVATFGAAVIRGEKNVLLAYPEWRSEKAELALGVMGAQSFLAAPNALSGRSLNLGAWHGYHSLILDRDWASVPSADFAARAAAPGYVSLEARSGNNRLAFRLSNDVLRPSAIVELDSRGNFLSRRELAFTLPGESWARLGISREEGAVVLREEGRELARHAGFPSGPARLVFRGSGSVDSSLDNISVRLGDEAYFQDFSGRIPWPAFLLFGLLTAIVLLAMRFLFGRGTAILAAWLFPVAAAAVLLFYEHSLSLRHPASLDLEGLPNRIESKDDVMKRLRSFAPARGRKTVLWLGGSQAWGAGASRPEMSAFSRVRDAFPGFSFVNGAISGAPAKDLGEPLAVVSSKSEIAAVVLIVGVNDAMNEEFSRDLSRLIAGIRAKAASILLVVEPATPAPGRQIGRSQAVVREVTEGSGLRRLDLQAAFEKRGDKGFDWWDFVHLTDSGQEFAASELSRGLTELLE